MRGELPLPKDAAPWTPYGAIGPRVTTRWSKGGPSRCRTLVTHTTDGPGDPLAASTQKGSSEQSGVAHTCSCASCSPSVGGVSLFFRTAVSANSARVHHIGERSSQ